MLNVKMLFYILAVKMYNFVENMNIDNYPKILRPVNTPNLSLSIINKEDGPVLIMKKFGNEEDSVVFQKEPNWVGYSLYVAKNKICYDEYNNKLIICKNSSDYTIWDVVARDGGMTICKPNGYKIPGGIYYFPYCLTIEDKKSVKEGFLVNMQHEHTNHTNQVFEIFEKHYF